MIKKFISILAMMLLLVVLITPSSAVYEKSTSFQSGSITSETIETTPSTPSYDNLLQIKNNLHVSSGTIEINTFVTNGPIKVSAFSGLVTSAITTNHGVSISEISAIKGPIHREVTTFVEKRFDYSIVPNDLPNLGDFSTNKVQVISSSGQYNNMNVLTPLTIDTTKQDVILVINHLNLNSDIEVIGKHRAIFIVKSNLNINGHRSINYHSKHSNFDLVVQAWSLNVQNNISFYGQLYFEGAYLYLRNNIEVYGAIFAPNAIVELSASTLYGALNCDSLTLLQNSLIAAKKN